MISPAEAAILAALDQGLTTQAGALAQAYWSLRGSGHWVPLERPPGPSIDLSLADGYVRCNYCHEVVTVDRWPQTTIALCAWVGDYYARHQFCADLMEEA